MSAMVIFRHQSRRVVFVAWASYRFPTCRLEISPESIKPKRTTKHPCGLACVWRMKRTNRRVPS